MLRDECNVLMCLKRLQLQLTLLKLTLVDTSQEWSSKFCVLFTIVIRPIIVTLYAGSATGICRRYKYVLFMVRDTANFWLVLYPPPDILDKLNLHLL